MLLQMSTTVNAFMGNLEKNQYFLAGKNPYLDLCNYLEVLICFRMVFYHFIICYSLLSRVKIVYDDGICLLSNW